MLLTAYEARPDARKYGKPEPGEPEEGEPEEGEPEEEEPEARTHQASPQKRNDRDAARNETIVPETAARVLHKRSIDHRESELWHLSMLSWDPELPFSGTYTFPDGVLHDPENDVWSSQWDDSKLGLGQTIYVMEAGWELEAVSIVQTCFCQNCYSLILHLARVRKRQPP